MPAGPSSGAGPKRGRPRRAETDRSIHGAALGLLRTGGPAAVTIEAVASESGVAKTTIYRRYADRDALLRAALKAAISAPVDPVGDTPREKIRWALEQTWRQMSEVLGHGGVSAILGNAQPSFTRLFRSVLTPYADALVDLIREDIAAGELRSDLDPDAVVSLLVGAYLGELLRRGRVAKGFSETCVDLIWVAMKVTPAPER